MSLFRRKATHSAKMKIKIKKGDDAVFSATHGISPINFPQSSAVREGTNVDREIGDIFYQERQAREAYGGELGGLRCEKCLCEAKGLCAGVY